MSMHIMPVSELRRKTSEVLNNLRDVDDEIYVTRYGHPVAVLVDYQHYKRLKGLSKRSVTVEEQQYPRPGAQYPTVANSPESLKNWENLIPDGCGGDALADTEALYDEV